MRENPKLTPRTKDQVLGCMVGGAVGDGRGAEYEADGNNNGSGYYGREEAHYLFNSETLEQSGEYKVKDTGDCHGEACVGEQLRLLVGGDGHITGQKREGTAQEGRYYSLCQQMKQKCT